MEEISKMTKKELTEEYIEVWDIINIAECYGKSELLWQNALEKEIIKRGMEIINRVEVK